MTDTKKAVLHPSLQGVLLSDEQGKFANVTVVSVRNNEVTLTLDAGVSAVVPLAAIKIKEKLTVGSIVYFNAEGNVEAVTLAKVPAKAAGTRTTGAAPRENRMEG